MDDETLKRIIAEIDVLASGQGARSHIVAGKPDGCLFVTANKKGLVSFARCFLQTALSLPVEENIDARPTVVSAAHVQILESKADFAIAGIGHSQAVPVSEAVMVQRKKLAWKYDGVYVIGCSIIGFISLLLMFSGIIFWIRIFTGNMR